MEFPGAFRFRRRHQRRTSQLVLHSNYRQIPFDSLHSYFRYQLSLFLFFLSVCLSINSTLSFSFFSFAKISFSFSHFPRHQDSSCCCCCFPRRFESRGRPLRRGRLRRGTREEDVRRWKIGDGRKGFQELHRRYGIHPEVSQSQCSGCGVAAEQVVDGVATETAFWTDGRIRPTNTGEIAI